MKLIVMVPCLNEEATLPQVIDSIPDQIPGISCIETLIVDDGSTDNTVAVAWRLGVDHIIRLKHNMGLARAFQVGLDACLDLGADIIVNTDGDNQYPSQAIPFLIGPILTGEADIAIGDRQTQTVKEFSALKKRLEWLGSWMVRTLSGAPDVRDAVSGFRAYSRYAASRNHLVSSYSHTIETVIQAGKKGLRILSVPIRTNPKTRPSRLYRNLFGFLYRSGATVVRSYIMYEPLKAFSLIGMFSFLASIGLGGQFLYFLLSGQGPEHMQSLVLSVVFFIAGISFATFGILADHIATNRRLLEELVWREKAGRLGLLESTHGAGILNRGLGGMPQESVSLGEMHTETAVRRSPVTNPAAFRDNRVLK